MNITGLSIVVLLIVQRGWHINTLQVIGGQSTVTQGADAVLFCRLSEANAEFDQITWQKATRENPENHNFFYILPNGFSENVNGLEGRVQFTGNTSEKIGSIRIKAVTLLDEGTYTCIFTVAIGPIKTEIPLTVLVPPVISVVGNGPPVIGDNEVVITTCVAAGAKPQAEVRWNTGALDRSLRHVSNSTQHANGTVTVFSILMGVPTRTANQQQVQCVVNQSALATEKTLPFTIEVHYAPQTVNITVSSQATSLSCFADSNPNPTYAWNRVGQTWPGSAVRTEGGELHFPSPSVELNGLYVCDARNIYGQATTFLYIHTASETSCGTCCVLLIILCLIVAAVSVLLWYRWKYGKWPWLPVANAQPPIPSESVQLKKIEEEDEGSNTPAQESRPEEDEGSNTPAQEIRPEEDEGSNTPAQESRPEEDEGSNTPAQESRLEEYE
ncbi:hypothetical protein UPYG_G00306310 [Umbra pygmaea]|uniref:Ig-like domain-containing protein n=1 Tax=Umbra pygmaea TaxID=75934 RepID=A0ABD0W311_UMBPY